VLPCTATAGVSTASGRLMTTVVVVFLHLRECVCCPLQALQDIFGNLCLLGQMVSMQKLLSTAPCLGILKVDTFIAPMMQSSDHAIRYQQSCQPN